MCKPRKPRDDIEKVADNHNDKLYKAYGVNF